VAASVGQGLHTEVYSLKARLSSISSVFSLTEILEHPAALAQLALAEGRSVTIIGNWVGVLSHLISSRGMSKSDAAIRAAEVVGAVEAAAAPEKGLFK